MILVDDFGIMRAIEIKWIRKNKNKKIIPSYYLGVGQALAYLSFGFKQVALWQCFDGNSLTDSEIFEYNHALSKIRNPLHPFLCATYFKIITEREKPRIQTRIFYNNRPTQWKDGIGIFLPKYGEFKMKWNCFNPFIKFISPIHQDINEQAKTIYEFLEFQKDKLWSK